MDNEHRLSEEETGKRAEAIVRKALADLRALNPGCDCAVMWGTEVMLALALDERVICEADAHAAVDMVKFLACVQSLRRNRCGLDGVTVDGKLHARAELEGPTVKAVIVRLNGQDMPIAEAVAILDAEVFHVD